MAGAAVLQENPIVGGQEASGILRTNIQLKYFTRQQNWQTLLESLQKSVLWKIYKSGDFLLDFKSLNAEVNKWFFYFSTCGWQVVTPWRVGLPQQKYFWVCVTFTLFLQFFWTLFRRYTRRKRGISAPGHTWTKGVTICCDFPYFVSKKKPQYFLQFSWPRRKLLGCHKQANCFFLNQIKRYKNVLFSRTHLFYMVGSSEVSPRLIIALLFLKQMW